MGAMRTDTHPALTESLERVRGLRILVGNTPLLAIEYAFDGHPRTLWAKAENLNLTGSIKDRMALHIVRRGYETGALEPGATIVEATSGNTGISFAAVGRALGHPVVIFMPDWMSEERKRLIRSFGARIELVSKEQGGFRGSILMAEEYAQGTPGAFLPRQFANELNADAHAETTGPEVWAQLGAERLEPDAFVAGVGTGGTIMGVGRSLRARKAGVRVHPVEPANSPTLSTGCKIGKHRIQGVSDEFVPPIVRLDQLDSVVSIDDGDSIVMAQRLAAELGLGVGISSGTNFLAAAAVREELGEGAVVVTVLPDSNKKYLSTDLMKEEPVREDFVAPHITLRRFHAVNRVCAVCWDPSDPASAPVGYPVPLRRSPS